MVSPRALAEGDGVLSDPLCLTVEDVSSEGEQRWVSIATNVFGTLYVVVWMRRGRTAAFSSEAGTERA